MRTAVALGVKFMLTLGAAALAGYFVDSFTWRYLLGLAFIGTIINYLLGDLFILPAVGNLAAAVADGIVAGILAYLLAVRNSLFIGSEVIYAIVFAFIVSVAELFFHKYLGKRSEVSP